MRILCSISTRGRYHTTLPLAINSVIQQTRKPDHLVIFDDNDEPEDMRNILTYQYLFSMLNEKNISWQVVYGEKKGQHFNHQKANTMGYDWVWRLDDDTVAEPNVLENLCSYIRPEVGAVGGSILTPPFAKVTGSTGKIEDIHEQSLQWDYIKEVKEVDHLHCSFIYRAGVYDYNLALSRVAHREETLFTYGLKKKGYKLFIIPNSITWHMKNREGGIRAEKNMDLYAQDEFIFQNYLKYKDKTVVVLDSGMGDHIVFKHVLPHIKNAEVFSCYPNIVPGKSIGEAYQTFGNLLEFNIYEKMDRWKWKDSIENAYRKLYGVDK
jgi:GT2 family glycosyltransferase